MITVSHLETYEKTPYQLIGQSLFFFLLVPIIYLSFIEIVSTDEIRFINDFEEPNYFNLDIKYVYYFQTISKAISIIITLNFAILLFINWYVGINHKRLINYYLPLYKITWLITKISTLLVIVIFIFLFVISINNIFPPFKLRWWSLIGIACPILGSLLAFFTVIDIIHTLDKKNVVRIIGYKVSEQDQPELFKLVKKCSNKIKASFPDNIVLGNTDGFFVISTDVLIINNDKEELLKGNTLYIPYLMFKILTQDELKGIIGHELAHFSGEDTNYSKKFKPAKYSLIDKFNNFEKGLNESKENENSGITGKIASFFTNFFLMMLLNPIGYIYINFIKKDYDICINQELRADKLGSSLCENKKSLISGLCKFYVYSQINKNIFDDLYNGVSKSLTSIFTKTYKDYLSSYKFKDILVALMAYEIHHPSDEHPPISERMNKLKINLKDIKETDLKRKIPSASSYLNDYDNLDELLS